MNFTFVRFVRYFLFILYKTAMRVLLKCTNKDGFFLDLWARSKKSA